MLLGAGHQTVVLDHNSEQLERLGVFGIKVFFGDASRPDLLHAAGIAEAKMLIVAIDDREQATEMVRHVAETYPQVYIIARAIDRHHVYELWAAGCRDIIRENFDGAIRTARSALEALGTHPFDAERKTRGFVDHDKAAMRALADVYDPDIPVHENPAYVARSKEYMAEQANAMMGRVGTFSSREDRGWVPPDIDDGESATAENTETRP